MLISNYCDCGDLLTNAIKEVFYLRTGVFHEYSSIGNASLKNKHILIYTSKISFHIFETHNGIANVKYWKIFTIIVIQALFFFEI